MGSVKKKLERILSEIPTGRTSGKLTDGCLVLEGGAFRGLYTQGFLDAMMQADLNLSCVIGVSAGALAGVNYVSGQIGRSARINIGYRRDGRYIGLRALLKSGSILDVGFLTEERGVISEKLDTERIYGTRQRLIAVATNLETGEPEYFEKGRDARFAQGLRASATMPVISPPVMIGGVPYLDGGCSCAIPYEWALSQGFEKIIVIRTPQAGFRKPAKEIKPALRLYRKYPLFARKLADSSFDFNHQCDETERLHREGCILRFAPSQPVNVSRLERNPDKLSDLYRLGYRDAGEHLQEIREYLFR